MKTTTLLIMAAGIGSRFGTGIKQLEPVGLHDEIIMDYSIHDAIEAGFNKIIFVIRKDIEEDFRERIGNRVEAICKALHVEIAYAFQDLNNVPVDVPTGRSKPWGTGQAVLAAKDLLHEPFTVINADDYYGKEAFVKVHDYLVEEKEPSSKMQICMAGFILENTLSENGTVTRGICRRDDQGRLTGITETHEIAKTAEGAGVKKEDGTITPLDPKSLVSMNMWGLTPEFLKALEEGFVEFLKNVKPGDLKAEYLLPTMIDGLMREGRAQVDVLKTHDSWFGVTYQEDKQKVVEAFRELVDRGVYSEDLYRK